MDIKRRTLFMAALGVWVGTWSEFSSAAELCKADGLSFEEILKRWSDEKWRADLDKSFEIVIRRLRSVPFNAVHLKDDKPAVEGGIAGELLLNGKRLGDTLENEKFKIPGGNYRGLMRYVSNRNLVLGPLGKAAQQGDFLLEVANVKEADGTKRTAILLHAGNKPWHSQGCILTGAARKAKDANGNDIAALDEGHVLRELRKAFYGADSEPTACPNKPIRIRIE